jgi:hypothetical protein
MPKQIGVWSDRLLLVWQCEWCSFDSVNGVEPIVEHEALAHPAAVAARDGLATVPLVSSTVPPAAAPSFVELAAWPDDPDSLS